MCYEQKEVRNEVVGEGQGLGPSERDESRANNVGENLYNQPSGAIQVNGLQIPEQQSQGSVIQWERFLPFRSLKVLLVENDDSTRHVVSALLQNCSYEVTAVANGLQAWKVLEDLTNHIDLVLTEVSVPFLSGIGLLLKIMSHKTLKNTPVIMMSSHDSMGMVFKCLSKGAVNFLVKPIRKNELKNLWQHIWRRCHSSSGSGSESGTETFKESAKPKSNNNTDNNSGSNDEHDYGSIGLDLQDGSDNGSGTQSSWTKRAAEVESHEPASPWDQLANAPASTYAQVIHMKPETFSNTWVHVTETKECQGQDEQLGNSDLQLECQHETKSTHPTNKRRNKQPEVDCKPFDRGELEPTCENISGKRRDQAPNDGSAIGNSTNPCAEIRAFDDPSCLSNSSQAKNKASCDSGELPSLELSLKRPRGVDVGTTAYDDCNVLSHSDLSAFSKYNNASLANQGPRGNVGSCYPLDNNSLAVKSETMHNFQSHSNDTPNQQSNGSGNDNDQGSAKFIPPKQEALNDRLESMSAYKYFHSSPFQPVQSGQISSPQKVIPGKADDVGIDTTKAQATGSQHQVQVQHHHHYYHHYHHHIHNLQQHQLQQDHDDASLKVTANAPQCESSNVFGVPTEGNARNYSVNRSASGSNHGSNGQNGSIAALNVGRTDIESDNGAAGNSGTSGLSRRINGSGADEDRIAQREAALTKFRQKRKERCFEKRVRYQSRKKLAEQRPRIRGQFVRQKMFDTKAEKDNQGNESDDNSCDSAR